VGDFRVEIPHFYEIVYSEGGRSMSIEIDLRDPVPCLYRSALRGWLPPYDKEPISQDRKDEILERVHSFLLANKFPKVEIDRTGISEQK
jgi:hypothetical protein